MPTTVTDLTEQIFEAALYECRQSLPDIEQFKAVHEVHKVSKEAHLYTYEQYLGLIDYCMFVKDFKDWLDDNDPFDRYIESEVEPMRKAIEACLSDCEVLMETR